MTASPARAALAALLLAAAPAIAADPVSIVRTVEADGTHTMAHHVVVDAPIAEVWAAISTPEGWRSWAVPVAWTTLGEADVLETSYDPAAKPGDPSTIRQQFLVRIPGRLLAFRTVKAPARFPHWEEYKRVSSVFELEPVGPRRTGVRLTGVGYPDSEAGRRLVGFFEAGNKVSLERLRKRFAEGPVDWSRRLGGK